MTLQSLKDKEGKQRETAGTYDQLFANLASGAESGWDYSSRWFTSPTSTLVDIEASYIVPCCLNSILLKAESDISYFHDVLCQHYMSQATLDGDVEAVDSKIEEHAKQRNLFAEAAKKRKAAMMKLLWNDGHGFWFDYHLKTRKQMETVSCAGLMPVWAGCWEGRWNISDVERFITFIRRTPGLLNPGGLSSTTNDSEEQWDFPNCWPPLVDFAVEALQKLAIKFEGCGAEPLATDIATRFISTGYRGWLKDKQMHEKYDSRVCTGERGTGGEYLPQTGFGWTNGTLLWLLQDYFDLSAKVLEGR